MRSGAWGVLALVAFVLAASPGGARNGAGPSPVQSRIDGVTVADKQRLVLRVENGVPQVVSEGAAEGDPPAMPLDNRVETVGSIKGVPSTAAPGTIVASLRNLSGRGAVLAIENGFDHPIIYDALIVTPGPAGPKVTRTTICPVAAGKVGFEQWPGALQAVVIGNVRTPPPGDMRCTGDTGLVNPAGLPPPNTCRGGEPDAAISVIMDVDPATGQRRSATVLWSLRDLGGRPMAPRLGLAFPMQGDRVAGRPTSFQVLAVVSTDPPPPANHAEIILLADGREITRRPWRLYAQQKAALATRTGKPPPIAFVGIVPFAALGDDGRLDEALAGLFARIGDSKIERIEVKIAGDDGSVLGQGVYDLRPRSVDNIDVVTTALHGAEALAAAPGHCAAPADKP